MQREGERARPSKASPRMPATDDEIREKYLERAIREINSLSRDIHSCEHCPRGNLMPVLGSGHPQADVMLVKFAPKVSEIEEGVAFYGRSGNALQKSLTRLGIDPLAVYGTLVVKCPVPDASMADPVCTGRLVEEFAIVQPRMLVAMGEQTVAAINEMELPLAQPIEWAPGTVAPLTPSCDVLVTPDIDDSLDEEDAKREFWASFRALGDWWSELPPY